MLRRSNLHDNEMGAAASGSGMPDRPLRARAKLADGDALRTVGDALALIEQGFDAAMTTG